MSFHSDFNRRLFTSKAKNLTKAFSELPWNFNAHLLKQEVMSLEAPVDLGNGILNSIQATTLFKEFVSGIIEGDLSYLKDSIEPKMYTKATQKISEAHDILHRQNLNLQVQNL